MKSKYLILGILAFFLLFFTSCNDSDLAKQLDGAWEGSYTLSFADGSKEKVQVHYSFTYDESREDDDGTFVETRRGRVNNPDFDGTYTCEYQSQIKGRWEVLMGGLYLHYNLNSLEVNVDPDDIIVKYDNSLEQLNYITTSIGYLATTFKDPKEDLAKDFKKEAYKSLFVEYSQINDGDIRYGELKVSNTEMSYVEEDDERMIFHRIDVNSTETETKTSTPRAKRGKDSVSETSHAMMNVRDFKGSVGKYPITMHLNIEGEKVNGSYYYNSGSSALKLSGTVKGNHIELNETTQEGRPTGHFDGIISDDGFFGEFINYKGEHFNFSLR